MPRNFDWCTFFVNWVSWAVCLFWKLISSPFKNFNLVISNWRIIALWYCVGFYQTSTWISHRYTYVFSLLNLRPTSLPIPPFQIVTEPYFEFPESLINMTNRNFISLVNRGIHNFVISFMKQNYDSSVLKPRYIWKFILGWSSPNFCAWNVILDILKSGLFQAQHIHGPMQHAYWMLSFIRCQLSEWIDIERVLSCSSWGKGTLNH